MVRQLNRVHSQLRQITKQCPETMLQYSNRSLFLEFSDYMSELKDKGSNVGGETVVVLNTIGICEIHFRGNMVIQGQFIREIL